MRRIGLLVVFVCATAFAPPGRPRFRLAAVGQAALATGYVELVPARSPFGVAATKDGHITYDLDINVRNLPAPSTLGAFSSYHAWLSTPNLDVVKHLGVVANDSALRAQADWNKFTIVVTAEPAAISATHWKGAIVLVGRSPSSLMQTFAGHPFYNTGI